jgi:uncharacterized protein (DUF4415 family)
MPRLLLVRALCVPLLASLLLPAMSLAQEQPAIAVTDLAQRQFAQDFLNKALAKEAEQARARAAAAPNAPKNPPVAEKPKTPGIDLTIDGDVLRRFTVGIKGELFKSGFYRLFPGKVRQSTNKETLADINEQIDKGLYPDVDYVLFGTISYVNTTMSSAPADNKQVAHTMLLEIVGEFLLINTRTRAVDVSFLSMGQGSDTRISKHAGTVIAINKSKILKQASESLASSVTTELEYQLTPKKIKTGTTPVIPPSNTPPTRTITLR